jgi:hypothetical protein
VDADAIVTQAAVRARVDNPADPVRMAGPSYEELKLAQTRAVGEPIEALVRKFESASSDRWMSSVLTLSSASKRAVEVAMAVERMLVAIFDNAVAEGRDLGRARVRDAKVAAILSLGATALSPGFLAAELKERTRSLGEAALVLAQIDAQPGLRELMTAEIRGAIDQGRAFVVREGLTSRAGLDAFLGLAHGIRKREQAGEILTARESQMLHALDRLETDTAFRIGVEAELTAPSHPR